MFGALIHMCYVWYQAVQCVQKAPSPKEHSLLKYFFFISIVILNASLQYHIDIFRNLVWILGSTYRKGEILMQM